jgi:HAD superfamily hydrolase (TIGR01549 family)
MKEYIAVVDENDKVVGKAAVPEILEKALLHRSANVMVFNSKGELFVHKRNRNLGLYPGMHDVKFGGMVNYGEDYEAAALRELKEEAGIKNVKLKLLFAMKTRSEKNNCNRKVFSCVYDGKLRLQEKEVESGKFMAVNDVTKVNVSPSAKDVFNGYKMQKHTKAVLFDLGGVLVKGDYPYWREVKFISNILGVTPEEKHSLAWRKIYLPLSQGKMSLKEHNREVEKIFGKTLPADFEERFTSYEQPKEKGIPKLLKALKEKGYAIGVLSNSYHEWAYATLQKIGAWDFIDAITISSEIRVRKPSKKAYLIALNRLGCSPNECIYLGDSQDDLDGARKAGMKTLFIKDRDQSVKGHNRISHLHDIVRLLE